MYLTKEDLLTSIRDSRLEDILQNQNEHTHEVLPSAIHEAQSLVRDYLHRFDIDSEFQKQGNQRHGSVVFYTKHLCLYILYERIEDENVPERIIKNYNDTIETLLEISKGKQPIALELKQVDSDGDGLEDKPKTKFRWGGSPLRDY